MIIVDPGQLPAAVKRVRAKFEKISSLPVKAIIYTHSHGDHTNGASAFYEPNRNIAVFARSNYGSEDAFIQSKGFARKMRPSNT